MPPPLAISSGLGIGFGVLYFILLVTLGVLSIRKGHWVMFIIGIFIPPVLANRSFAPASPIGDIIGFVSPIMLALEAVGLRD